MNRALRGLLVASAGLASSMSFAGPVAIWAQPVALAAGLASGGAYVPVGLSVGISPRVSLSLEAAFLTRDNSCGLRSDEGCRTALRSWIATAGVMFFWRGDRSATGFFVQPKLMVGRSAEFGSTGNPSLRTSFVPGLDTEVGVALDVGYAFRWNHVYVAPVLGIGAAQCGNCQQSVLGTPLGLFRHPSALRTLQDFPTFNLNLVRAGFLF